MEGKLNFTECKFLTLFVKLSDDYESNELKFNPFLCELQGGIEQHSASHTVN